MKDKPRYVEVRTLVGGEQQFVWNPPSVLRASGEFKFTVLGADKEKAFREAVSLNNRLDLRRPGQKRTPSANLAHINVEELCRQYRESSYFLSRADLTKKGYRSAMRSLCNTLWDGRQLVGDMPIQDIRPRTAEAIYGALLEKHGKASASGTIRFTKRLFKLAYKWEMIESNPFSTVELGKAVKRRVVWTPEQVQAFVTASHELGRPSVGLILLMTYALGQRLSDMIRLTWDHVGPDCEWVKHVQQKGDTPICVPCPPELQALLKKINDRSGVIAKPEASRCESDAPWLDNSYSQCARRIMDHAKLPRHLWARDMRRTCLTELGLEGATEDELMSVSGHASRDSVAPYVVHQTRMAENAMRKRQSLTAFELS